MTAILYILFAPTVYLVLATVGLLQFSIIFNAFSNIALHVNRTPALEAVAPGAHRYRSPILTR